MTSAEIRNLRARLGWSVVQAAATVGVSEWTWRQWEGGHVAPSPASLTRLHAYLDPPPQAT